MNVRDIIKKLFAVADDDASTDGEIDNAMQAAMNLMAAHRITREDLFTADGEVQQAPPTFARTERYTSYAAITAWETLLCYFITAYVPGTGWYVQSGQLRRNHAGMAFGGKATKITFYGPDIDARLCADIFDEANVVIKTAATLRFGKALSRGDAASYAEGFCRALTDSQKRQQQVLEQDKKYALVCVKTALATVNQAKQWLKEEHAVNLRSRGRSCRSQAYNNQNAYAQGQRDGANYRPGAQRKAGLLT